MICGKLQNARESKLGYLTKEVDYKDYVYDVELPKWHVLLVRRNEKLFGVAIAAVTLSPKNHNY